MKTGKIKVLLLLFLSLSLLPACTSNGNEEYDTEVSRFLKDMGLYLEQKFEEQAGWEVRAISQDFDEEVYDLQLLTILAFGSTQLKLHLTSYESDYMANASISSFEVPPGSDSYSDCAFVVRPNANLRAPLMHGDGLKYMAGMGGKLSMDFYIVEPDYEYYRKLYKDNDTKFQRIIEEIKSERIETFFGSETENLETALELVDEWRVTESSSYTDHLNTYKTKYRLETEDPGKDNATAIERYTEAAYEAFTIYVDAYMNSLNSLIAEDNETLMQANITGISNFIKNQVENDFVYFMGSMILGAELDTYFLDAFWREDVYFTRLEE